MAKKNHAWLIAFLILSLSSGVYSEYFGRNKVRYEKFDFKELKTDHFRIYYYPTELFAVKDAARMLERWNDRYQKIFLNPLSIVQPVILYANHADFQQTNAIGGLIPQGTGGVTEGLLNRMILPLTGIYSENDHVLGHELVHAFQYDILKSNDLGLTAEINAPLWFVEGMAEYLSLGSYSPLTAMWMRDAVAVNDVPSIQKLGSDSKYFPYRYGHALWAYIAGKYGDDVIEKLYLGVLQSGWQNGFSEVLGISLDSLSHEWTDEIKTTFSEELKGRELPSQTGRRILNREEINLSPKISPNGKYLAVFSSKDLFSIDLFIVDVHSGKIVKRFGGSESDLHFDALRYVNSIGTWSNDAKQFAFVIYRKGNSSIGIVNVKKGIYKKTVSIKGVDDINDLAWSPDGSKMAFSGTSGGISNLYLYSFTDKSVTKLTDDNYSDLMPSWSPDGKKILFATDRECQTDFDMLKFSPLKIGVYTLENGDIDIISLCPWAKHIDPQYSVDGKSIYFISDPDGFSDIYRYSIDEKAFYRVTNITTGVSGLTENSSAMSIAAQNGQIVFNVFENGNYKVQLLDSSQICGKKFTPIKIDYYKNVKLPPAGPDGLLVNHYLENPDSGLSSSKSFLTSNYKPHLKLLYVGQLFAGISADPLGIGMAGGVSFVFSDMLGDHMLGAGAQVSGGIQDFGGEVIYLNIGNRVNWGYTFNRVPYFTTSTTMTSDTATVDGGTKQVNRVTFLDQRIYDNNVSGLLALPISTDRRFELNAGFTRENYNYRAEDVVVYNNTIIEDRTHKIDAPSPLNLIQSALAYVGDFAFFGLTGPVSGRRFRLEVGATTGSLNYLTLLADYRQYFFFNPLSLAVRFFHYGRYLRDSQNERLTTLYLGDPVWIRGYEYSSFDLTGYVENTNTSNYPEYDRLIGTRIGVFNAELRLPFFGVKNYGLINFPYLPMDLVAFLDGGVAWYGNDKPVPELVRYSNERIPVFSAGGAARFNLFGLIVLQIYYAYPFQRTDMKGHWGFVFAPAY